MALINNVYLYIKKNEVMDCAKYGIKLSEYSDIQINNNCGIIANFAPKDSEKYDDINYSILRINCENLNVYVLNNETKKIYTLKEYEMGSIRNPKILIFSSILPSNIFIYNNILDVPLIVDSSEELYESILEEKELENMDIDFNMLKNKLI